MPNDEIEATLRALASDRRLLILAWLKDPRAHFAPQVDGDLVSDVGLRRADRRKTRRQSTDGERALEDIIAGWVAALQAHQTVDLLPTR